MKLFTLLFLFFSFGSTQSLRGEILNVPLQYSTIQTAIDAANNSDTVLVSEGTYYENIRYKGKGIVVTSRYFITKDWQTILNTIINGSTSVNKDTASTVQFLDKEDSTAILDGFTITGGTGTRYLFPNGTGTNKVQEGAGIILHYSSAIIKNNIITMNSIRPQDGVANGGGGGIASMYGNPTIYHNIIFSNTAGYAGGLVLNWSKGTVKNNIIYHNTGTGKWGCGGIMIWRAPQHGAIVENNTIIGNKADSSRSGGIEISAPDSTTIPVVKNNIVWGNRQAKGKQITNAKYIENNIVEDYSDRTNISQYPKFVEQSFQLTPSLETNRNDMGAFGGSTSITFPLLHLQDIYLSKNALNDTAVIGHVSLQKIEILNTSSSKIRIDSIKSSKGVFLLSNIFTKRTLDLFETDTLTIYLTNPSIGIYTDTINIYHTLNGLAHPLRIPVTMFITNTKKTESFLPRENQVHQSMMHASSTEIQ